MQTWPTETETGAKLVRFVGNRPIYRARAISERTTRKRQRTPRRRILDRMIIEQTAPHVSIPNGWLVLYDFAHRSHFFLAAKSPVYYPVGSCVPLTDTVVVIGDTRAEALGHLKNEINIAVLRQAAATARTK